MRRSNHRPARPRVSLPGDAGVAHRPSWCLGHRTSRGPPHPTWGRSDHAVVVCRDLALPTTAVWWASASPRTPDLRVRASQREPDAQLSSSHHLQLVSCWLTRLGHRAALRLVASTRLGCRPPPASPVCDTDRGHPPKPWTHSTPAARGGRAPPSLPACPPTTKTARSCRPRVMPPCGPAP